MSSLSLNLAGNVRPKQRRRYRRKTTRERIARMGAVEQMVRAFSSGNRLSACMGIVLGGFVPIAVYALVHYEVAEHPMFWCMVVGGLAYSAVSVFKWAENAFHMRLKAIGFVLLLEGAVTFSHERWLGFGGLVLLVGINGISAAVALQVEG